MKKNDYFYLLLLIASGMYLLFSTNVFADNGGDEKHCLNDEQRADLAADGAAFVICVNKHESDFKIHRFANQNLRVSIIKGTGDDLLDCESSTNNAGVIICEIDCDINERKDRKKRIYEVKMLDVNARQYYLSKGKSTDFVEVNEKGFTYQFKFKNCKAITKEPLPNNIYILYRSRELDERLIRMRSRN